MRGSSFVLNGDIPATQHTLAAIPRVLGKNLRTLELTEISKYSDSTYSSLIKDLPNLEKVVLRQEALSRVGCIT